MEKISEKYITFASHHGTMDLNFDESMTLLPTRVLKDLEKEIEDLKFRTERGQDEEIGVKVDKCLHQTNQRFKNDLKASLKKS